MATVNWLDRRSHMTLPPSLNARSSERYRIIKRVVVVLRMKRNGGVGVVTDMTEVTAIVEVANEKCRVFREADHGVAEAVNSQVFCLIPVVSGPVFEDNGRGICGQCPGRWQRWTPVAKSLRIWDILSI